MEIDLEFTISKTERKFLIYLLKDILNHLILTEQIFLLLLPVLWLTGRNVLNIMMPDNISNFINTRIMNNKELEEIFNETFAGLALFYRDTKLDDQLISKYQVGQIIMERGFT